MRKDSEQDTAAPKKFTLGPLGNLNQVTKDLAKTIRAMASGEISPAMARCAGSRRQLASGFQGS
jgi:hypothetical protein